MRSLRERFGWRHTLAFAVFLFLVLRTFDSPTGFSSLAGFGAYTQSLRTDTIRELNYAVKPESFGYDGQFYAQLAMDPTLRDPDFTEAIDAPAYRSRRILLPAVAYALGMGRPPLILQVYSLLNVACWFVFAWQVAGLIPTSEPPGRRFARWAGVLFSVGVLDSVRYSMTDLPAVVLMLSMIRAMDGQRTSGSAAFYALAVLCKETSIPAWLARAPARLQPLKPWLAWVALGILAVLPFAAWYAYVLSVFEPYVGARGNLTWPLAGMLDRTIHAVGQLLSGNPDTRYLFGVAAAAGFSLQLVLLLLSARPSEGVWRLGCIYGVLMLFLGVEPWRGYWAVARIVIPLTLAFNLYLPGQRRFWPYWILGNATLLHGWMRFW